MGKTWFDRALEATPELNFEIIWKPFQLNPEMPKNGMSRNEYLKQKFGGTKRAREAYAPIIKTAVDHKIDINFDKIKITPNTLNAQRLIYWAEIEGVQGRIVSGLFKAYFKDGKDIGDPNILSEIAGNSGMKKELVTRLLSSQEDVEKVKDLDLSARNSGIKGVPMFLIDKTYAVSGAQSTEFWRKVFLEISVNQRSNKSNFPAS
tara:strand:+ start:212 stop:826 length:615 start_codon:yes stop_codon:yes gene_type:complete